MTHSAKGHCNRSNVGLPGRVSWQLTASDIVSLAVNVVQNGRDYRELRPDLQHMTAGSAAKRRSRRSRGDAPVPDATRTMLEEVHQEILRANRRGAARAVDQLAGSAK
jgi:hypothetical protein